MVYTVYVKQILYYVATNTWHHQIMFHFLLRSYLPTLVISNQIFVQYCGSNVSLFAALQSLNGLYKCMELSQQFATFMKLALVCRIYICLFTFQRTVPPWKTYLSQLLTNSANLSQRLGAETNFQFWYNFWQMEVSDISNISWFLISELMKS